MSYLYRVSEEHWPIKRSGPFRHLYIIQEARGPIKIGIAANAFWRLTSLQVGNPRPLSISAVFESPDKAFVRTVENWVHAEFADSRVFGEWFSISASDAINKIEGRFL